MDVPLKAGIAIFLNDANALGPDMSAVDAEMTELALLLPRWQALALQNAAKKRGLTTAQMLRRMIGAIVGAQPPSPAN